jgi:hypothetical protein
MVHFGRFDHRIGAGQKGFWNCHAYGLRTLHIHDLLKPGRLFDRQIARLRATKNFRNHHSALAKQLDKSWSITE